MELREHRVGRVLVLELSGRFDRSSVKSVAQRLETGASRTSRIVVDLSSVSFLDSTALSALVQAMRRCRDNGGDLRLSGLRRPIKMVFESTRLDRAFVIASTQSEAVDSLQA